MTEIDEKIQRFVDKKDRRTMENVREVYEEKLEDVRENYEASGVTDEQVQTYAWDMARGIINNNEQLPGDTVQFLVIGNLGIRNLDRYENGQSTGESRPMLTAMGIAAKGDGSCALSAIRLDGDSHDPSTIEELPVSDQPTNEPAFSLEEAQDVLQPLSVLEINGQVYDYDQADLFWNVYTNPETEFTESSGDYFPVDVTDVVEARDFISNYMEGEAEFTNIREYLQDSSKSYTQKLAEMYEVEATIVDHYLSEDGEIARYTLQDSSVEDASEYDLETIRGGRENSIGLTAWVPDERMMKYGTPSRCKFYGTFRRGQNGQVSMNVAGIAPVIAKEEELERYERNNSGSSDSSQATRAEASSESSESGVEEQFI